jgi:hypothetical protein
MLKAHLLRFEERVVVTSEDFNTLEPSQPTGTYICGDSLVTDVSRH